MKKVYICSNENKLYIGKWTSKIGNVVFDYVNTIAIVSSCRTGSVFLAIYQASEVLISIIFNLIGGVIADGSNKKRLLIYTDIFSGIVSLILSFFVESSYIVVLIIIANIILAIISAYNSPIYRSIIREMVYKEKIGKYNAISNAGYQIAAVISPLLALYFVNRFNSRVALIFNACTFFVSAMMEIMLKPINSNPEKIMEKKFIQNLFNGIKYLVHPKGSIFEGIKMRENPEDAFNNAIKRGMKNPDDWMYMYSENNKDYFKNYYTRGYRSYPQFGIKEKIKNRFKER